MVAMKGVAAWLCLTVPAAMAKSHLPYSLGVRDSLMIAHSFHNNPQFGPAGGMVRVKLDVCAGAANHSLLIRVPMYFHHSTIVLPLARSNLYM